MMIAKVSIPEGVSGKVSVQRYEVTRADADFDRLRAMITGRMRATPAGEYTGLYRGGALWMSDTPDEMRDHYHACGGL